MLLPHFQREDVIAIENNGQNALHMTAENQSCQMLEVLLLTGHFNVRARESRRGRTCLHYALSYGKSVVLCWISIYLYIIYVHTKLFCNQADDKVFLFY